MQKINKGIALKTALLGVAAATSASAMAAAPDVSALTSSIDLSSVQTGILSVAGILIGLYVVRLAAKYIMSFVKAG